MDAADRAELERLRRRVFGPEGDNSPAVLRRLELLETELHASAPPKPDPEPAPPPPPPPPRTPTKYGTPTPLRTVATLAGVVAVLLLGFRLMAELPQPEAAVRTEMVSAREAYTLVRDAEAVVVERIPLDDPPAGDIDPDAPWFPTSGTVAQATHAATLYGWEVWIAEAEGVIQREACISVRRAPVVRGRCVPAVLRATNALAVTLPFSDIDPDVRPRDLVDGQRIGFWWAGAGGIYVLLADDITPLP